MMGAIFADDQIRIVLDDAIAIINDAQHEQRDAMMLLAEAARTAEEGDVLRRMAVVRKRLTDAQRVLLSAHPNKR
jgi:hypothetical protein